MAFARCQSLALRVGRHRDVDHQRESDVDLAIRTNGCPYLPSLLYTISDPFASPALVGNRFVDRGIRSG
ncbi:MAG: hypothetical protein MJZ58_05575 [Paludibacteraceae bacterium]|nr:hypothetical protein [Paludibacteraceae bacterium]